MTTLSDLGVKPIEAVGKEFDANFHNAVMHVDDESKGENEITYEGDNTTSVFDYALSVVPSFGNLAVYAITNWLVKTVINLPKILYYVIKTDTF